MNIIVFINEIVQTAMTTVICLSVYTNYRKMKNAFYYLIRLARWFSLNLMLSMYSHYLFTIIHYRVIFVL